MNLILEKMARTAELIYEVNDLMRRVGDGTNSEMLSNVEDGRKIDLSGFEDERAELFEKRQKSFELYNQVISMIGALSKEEKEELAEHIGDLVERNLVLQAEKELAYQNIIDVITAPSFSFEGNEKYKQKIIDLKEEYNKTISITQFYERMEAYLTTYKRK